jgi:hypothetical protein
MLLGFNEEGRIFGVTEEDHSKMVLVKNEILTAQLICNGSAQLKTTISQLFSDVGFREVKHNFLITSNEQEDVDQINK